MKKFLQNKSLWLAFAATGLITLLSFLFSRKKVDYISEVKPILNKKCIACLKGLGLSERSIGNTTDRMDRMRQWFRENRSQTQAALGF